MRTPGHDRELAAGFLTRADLLSVDSGENSVLMTLADGVDPEVAEIFTRVRVAVCAEKRRSTHCTRAGCAMLPHVCIRREVIHGLPEKLRAAQSVFEHTGGLHGTALFDTKAKLEAVREDVGRHDAVDKLIGAAFLDGRFAARRTHSDAQWTSQF